MSNRVSEDGRATVKMSSAAEELTKRLVKLYSAEIFVREGKELREQILRTGLDAASRLAGISMLSERAAKVNAANETVILLTRVVYTANVMFMLGLYTQKQVAPVINYSRAVLSALRELLSNVPEKRRVIRVKNPVRVVTAQSDAAEGDYVAEDAGDYVESFSFVSGFDDGEGNSDGFDDIV